MTIAPMLFVLVSVAQPGPLTHTDSLTESLSGPARIAVAADGTVLVTDPLENHIARFNAAGGFIGSWAVPEGPIGVAIDVDGRIFVSRRDDARVAVHDSTFVFQSFLGNGTVTFINPTDLDIATDTGQIYVVDSGADLIYYFDNNGSDPASFGIRGELPGQMQHPSAIAVDETNGLVVVADHDNFRIQTFTPSGFFQQRIGYRIMYLPGGVQEGWMPRSQGVAVDADGYIYLADAMMSTVRILSPTGTDLGKVVTYGSASGDLRTPCDLALSPDGSRLYVVSTNTATIEVYATPVLGVPAVMGLDEEGPQPTGTNRCTYDKIRLTGSTLRAGDLSGDWHSKKPFKVDRTDRVTRLNHPDTNISAVTASFEGPHFIDSSNDCGRCHGIYGQPGVSPNFVEGQTTVCLSCHSSGGQALTKPLPERSKADPFGTNPKATDGRGTSHAWGVSAVNASADSNGPAPGGIMDQYLDSGQIKCTTCHNQHDSAPFAPYLRVSNEGDAMCKECHAARNQGPGEGGSHPVGFDYPGGVGEFPSDAALEPLALKSGNVECSTCHGIHNVDSGGANGGDGDGMLVRTSNDETLCQTCHANHVIHTPGGYWQPTCLDCHDPHDPNNTNLSLVAGVVTNQTLVLDKLVVFAAQEGLGSFDDGDPAVNDGICQVCHTATTYHRHDGTGAAHNDGANCTSCHPHSTGFMPAGGVSCIACHSSPQDNNDGIPLGGRPQVVNADGTGGHHNTSGLPLTDGDCVVCHEMSQHQAGTVRLWSDPNNATTPLPLTGDPNELVPFCSNCHDSLTHPTIHTAGAAWEPVCTECHSMHDPASSNLSLVRSSVHNDTMNVDKPVVFTAKTGANSFDDGDPAVNDGICQVCHTSTSYHKQDGTGTVHNDGTDCTSCHPHTDGFMPTNASCQDCHNTVKGPRRAVIGEFAYASHHLRGALLDDADCVVCHDMSQHQAGNVRLLNVDDPTNPAAVVVLNGDPSVSSAEAVKLEAFCLACHDSNGASGDTTPFTGGLVAPAVDSVLWNNGSHRASTMTCFGDGQMFGCHDTGHGSNKRMMLAPSSIAATRPAKVEEEEGFCYTCHDANGPASTNMQSQFALSSHHNVAFADQADGSKVECLNCHNPHTTSAAAKLIDPDSGAVWTGGDPSFCLACHDGAPPVGVSFGSGSMGTGYDKSAYPGTTHATQLGGNTCRHCHLDHGSQWNSMLREQFVVTDDNQYSAGNGDYAMCWVCHDETETIQNDNAFTNLHKKHVGGAVGPCIICHDVHAGFDAGEPGLINFANSVQLGYNIQFIDGRDGSTSFWINVAQDKGNCYLKCHSKTHGSKSYDRLLNPIVDCGVCHTQ